MRTWDDYVEMVRSEGPEKARMMDEIENTAHIIGEMIERRHNLNLSQRDLAKLCGIPHSSVARIESLKVSPRISTLHKIFDKLGMRLRVEVTPIETSKK